MSAHPGCITWGRWLAWFALVASAHAGVWYGATHSWLRESALTPLPVVQVSLVQRSPRSYVTPLRAASKRKPIAQPERRAETRPPSASIDDKPAPQPPAPEPVAAETLAPAPETYVQPVFSASYLNNPPPAYPLAARRRGHQGTVIVRAEISSDGDCRQAALKKGSGHPLLDKAAMEAVRKWRFVPAKRGNTAITAWVEVPITFKLEDS